MYESPINLFVSDIATQVDKQIEATIVTAVQKVGIDVDKDELIKALAYDRNQYEKGYRDGCKRKTGHWIPQDFNKSDGMMTTAVYYFPKCSVCGHTASQTNFCPACGADMRGEST